MKAQDQESRIRSKGTAGFSLTELVVAMAIAMVLMAVSMPAFLRAYHSYQLTHAASQFADILRLTRFEAIRRNSPVSCVIKPVATDPTMTNAFADVDGDLLPGPTEKIVLLGSGGNLVDAGLVPGTAGLIAAAQVTSATVTPPAGNAAIAFDARGSVTPPTVSAFYLASGVAPEAGFRAVLLMPAGSIQVWTGDIAGNWAQIR
jgi:Tfp pilus assembly protein FimT